MKTLHGETVSKPASHIFTLSYECLVDFIKPTCYNCTDSDQSVLAPNDTMYTITHLGIYIPKPLRTEVLDHTQRVVN